MKLTDLQNYKAQLVREYADIPKKEMPSVTKAEVNLLWLLIEQDELAPMNNQLTSVNWHNRVPTEKEQEEELRCFIRLMKFRHKIEMESRYGPAKK